jgi:hypothetical protein
LAPFHPLPSLSSPLRLSPLLRSKTATPGAWPPRPPTSPASHFRSTSEPRSPLPTFSLQQQDKSPKPSEPEGRIPSPLLLAKSHFKTLLLVHHSQPERRQGFFPLPGTTGAATLLQLPEVPSLSTPRAIKFCPPVITRLAAGTKNEVFTSSCAGFMSNVYSLRRWRRRRSSPRSGCREVSAPGLSLYRRFFLGTSPSPGVVSAVLLICVITVFKCTLFLCRSDVPSPGRKGVAFGRSCARMSPRRPKLLLLRRISSRQVTAHGPSIPPTARTGRPGSVMMHYFFSNVKISI